MNKPMMKSLALSTLVFAISCGTVSTASPSVSPSTALTASASPSVSASALPGSTFSMPVDREMLGFFVDRGALIARSTKDSSAPYESTIWRAEPTSATWRSVYVSDAMFQFEKVANGRMALVEYREPVQGGGAFSGVVVITDLVTGGKIEMDRFSLSAATYRGGGGAPRRPVTAVALDVGRAAWTRLVEGPAGAVMGELRLASIADPRAQQVIASSSEWIQPIGLDSRRLVYILGGKTEDQLRTHEITSGIDTLVATAPVRDTSFFGPPGIDRAAVSGDWAIWIDEARVAGDTTQAVAVNLTTGERRTLDPAGTGCASITAGSRYFAWSCAKSNGTAEPYVVLDSKTLTPIALARQGPSYGLVAADDAVIWLNAVNGGQSRTVTVYRP
jgi:hypothetical protein